MSPRRRVRLNFACNQTSLPWQCLNFLPDPQGQVSLRAGLPHVVASASTNPAMRSRDLPVLRGRCHGRCRNHLRLPLLLLRQKLRHHRLLFFLATVGRICASFCVTSCRSEFSIDFKQRKAFGLVFLQRVALRIATEPDHRPQVFQPQQMFAPFARQSSAATAAFRCCAWLPAPKAATFSSISLSACLDNPLADHVLINAFFRGPIGDRQLQAQLVQCTPSSSPARPTGRHRISAACMHRPDRRSPDGACPAQFRPDPRPA